MIEEAKVTITTPDKRTLYIIELYYCENREAFIKRVKELFPGYKPENLIYQYEIDYPAYLVDPKTNIPTEQFFELIEAIFGDDTIDEEGLLVYISENNFPAINSAKVVKYFKIKELFNNPL